MKPATPKVAKAEIPKPKQIAEKVQLKKPTPRRNPLLANLQSNG